MLRRTLFALLVVGILAVTTVVVLGMTLSRTLDAQNQCETGYSSLITCTYHSSMTTVGQGKPDPAWAARAASTDRSSPDPESRPGYFDSTIWAVAYCPQNAIARHLLCPVPATASGQAVGNDVTTGLPLPRPWLLRTARNSPFIESEHVETPLDLASVLAFYRRELGKRAWIENEGVVIAQDQAAVPFTTPDGLAQLHLTRRGDSTIVDLSVRKPAFLEGATIVPHAGQAKLMLGNDSDEAAVITVDEQAIALPADAKFRGNQINLPPGKIKVALKLASGASQASEFEVGANETWGVLAGPDGLPLPVRLY